MYPQIKIGFFSTNFHLYEIWLDNTTIPQKNYKSNDSISTLEKHIASKNLSDHLILYYIEIKHSIELHVLLSKGLLN